MITQRNVSPGDYLQPGAGSGGRPLFVLEQTDPVRVFVGVPELASFSSIPRIRPRSACRRSRVPRVKGKSCATAFSLDPSTRTLQTEIDVPNSDDHLHPGWYVTVSIAIERKRSGRFPRMPSQWRGQQNYFVYLEVDGKPVRTPVIIGPSDDTHTEVLKKYSHRLQHQRLARVRRHRARDDRQPRDPRGKRRHRRGCAANKTGR